MMAACISLCTMRANVGSKSSGVRTKKGPSISRPSWRAAASSAGAQLRRYRSASLSHHTPTRDSEGRRFFEDFELLLESFRRDGVSEPGDITAWTGKARDIALSNRVATSRIHDDRDPLRCRQPADFLSS